MPQDDSPRNLKLRSTLILAVGAVALVVGAWMAARGFQSSVAPLAAAWQLVLTWMFGDSARPAPAIGTFIEAALWFAGSLVALLLGWAMILRSIDLFWPGRRKTRSAED